MYIRTVVDYVLGFVASSPKEHKAKVASMFKRLPIELYPRSAKEVPEDGGKIHPYFEKCAALYSAAHFGHIDEEAWKMLFMPIIVCKTKYHSQSKSSGLTEDYPLSTKNKPQFA